MWYKVRASATITIVLCCISWVAVQTWAFEDTSTHDGHYGERDDDAEVLQSEERSLGGLWIAVFCIGIASWWLLAGRRSTSGSEPSSPKVPDAEEMRRKRLAALERSAASGPAEVLRSPPDKNMPIQVNQNKVPSPAASPVPAMAVPAAVNAAELLETCRASPAPPMPASPATVPKVSAANEQLDDGQFALQLRGILRGVSSRKTLEGLTDFTTVGKLEALVLDAFTPESLGSRVRLFFNGKELKKADAALGSLGMVNSAMLQVMFISDTSSGSASVTPDDTKVVMPADNTAQTTVGFLAATAPVKTNAAPPPETAQQGLSVRVQGALSGTTTAHVIEGLTGASTIMDLEDRVVAIFGAGDDIRARLFFMGRELKDADAYLSSIGLKSGATVQAMFAAGLLRPRRTPKKAASEPTLIAGAQEAVPSLASMVSAAAFPGSAQVSASNAEAAEAIMAAASASGCNPSAMFSGQQTQEVPAATPEEAWRAMAALELQLGRSNDTAEAAVCSRNSLLLHGLH